MSFSLSKTSTQRIRTEMSPSPRKKINTTQHKVLNQDKLKVFIKLKPLENNKNCLMNCINEKQLEIQTALTKKVYSFDHIFTHNSTSGNVFNIGCKSLIQQVMEGLEQNKKNNNALVFVYGNTGTGKTHTMGLLQEVSKFSTGIVPDSFTYIFNKIKQSSQQIQICLSFCQIYRDQIYDLLDFQLDKKLAIRQNNKSKEPFIQDLIMIQVNTIEQAHQVVNIGLQKRKIAEQKINKRSSRGHGIITVYFKNSSTETAKISFVDLAGCQRIKQSESKGATLNQAVHINSSLSALETLLMNISDKNIRSYRGNKLTRILQPYFEYGKIHLFVTSNYQSIQSIQFAKRCKGIKFMERQIKRQSILKSSLMMKESQLQQRYNKKIQKIKNQFALREKNLIFCIANLSSIVSKLYQHISMKISNQTVFSSFSFPQIFKQIQMQAKINNKINNLQKYQQKIIQNDDQSSQHSKISRTSTNMSQSLSQEIFNAVEKPQQLIKSMQQISLKIVEKVNTLTDLIDYKNIYKKQLFTSQMKNTLLQNKNSKFQKAIQYLLSINANDKRVSSKLAQFGIALQKQQKSENKCNNSNSKTNKTTKQQKSQNSIGRLKAMMTTPKKQNQLKAQNNKGSHFLSFNCQIDPKNAKIQPKRGLIYIDQ